MGCCPFNQKPLQTAAGATGAGESIQTATVTEGAYTEVLFDVTITNTATVTFQGRVGSGTWYAFQCTDVTTGTAATTATASGLYRGEVTGFTEVRANITAWTSGSVTVNATVVAKC